MAKTTRPKYTADPFGVPFGPGHPLYDPIRGEEEGPRLNFGGNNFTEEEIEAMIAAALGNQPDFSSFMTAADARELFQNMDTGQIEANVLQKMGVPDFLTNTQVQDAINQALGATDFLSQEDVARMIAEQGGPDLSDYVRTQDISGFLSEQQISNMIKNAQMQGMTEQQIMDMIKQATGGQMSDDAIRELVANQLAGLETGIETKFNAIDQLMQGFASADEVQTWIQQALGEGMTPEMVQGILSNYLQNNPMEGVDMTTVQQMIADATAGVPGIDEIQRMIDEGLANGLSPEQINQMISEYLASNPIEGITAEGVQQMIADAIAGIGGEQPGETALTEQQIQDLIGQQGYLTEDQIKAMMGEAGYLGEQGVNSAVQAALDAALGEGGAISAAIATATQNAGGGSTTPGYTPPEMDFGPGSYTPPPAGDPYGGQNPYALMLGQNYGKTPFAGGTTTGAENPYGLGSLDLGNVANYRFNTPTPLTTTPYPTGISSMYFQAPEPDVPTGPFGDPFGDPFTDPNHPLYGTIDPVPNFERPPGG